MMLFTENLSSGIQNLYDSTPDSIKMTAFGRKIKSGIKTDDFCVIFGVEKKLPLNQLSGDYIVPKTIEIDNNIYQTDVVEYSKAEALGFCYNFNANPLPSEIIAHRSRQRPLKGGIVISVDPFTWLGTFGLICVDNETQSLVGLTNAHVAIGIPQCVIPNNQNDVNDNSYSITGKRIIQFTEGQPASLTNDVVGNVYKFFPIRTGNYQNYIDAATFSIRKCNPSGTGFIDNLESFKQLGIPYNDPMPFATTNEINSLVVNNIPIYSAGRTTGPKGLAGCRLFATDMFLNQPINFEGIPVDFYDLITFKYEDNANDPSADGDSGSIVIGDFNGIFKIVGLLFAGSINTAYFCRIDTVASKLGISAWDGTPKNYLQYPPKFITTSLDDFYSTTSDNSSLNWSINRNNYYFAGFIHKDQINNLNNLQRDVDILPCISLCRNNFQIDNLIFTFTCGTPFNAARLSNGQTLITQLNTPLWLSPVTELKTSANTPGLGVTYALPANKNLWRSNGALPNSWSVIAGSLPPGVSLSTTESDLLVGTPTAVGNYTATIRQCYCTAFFPPCAIFNDSVINIQVVNNCESSSF